MRRYGLLAGQIESLVPSGLDRQRVVAQTDIDKYITARPAALLGRWFRSFRAEKR